MPSNWLYVDTNFPTFTGEESPNEKIDTIQNYMYMLLEQLRYTLHNLDTSNMNQTALTQFQNYLTEPIYSRIEDDEGHINALILTAEGLSSRVSDAEGNISEIDQYARSITLAVTNGETSSVIELMAGGISIASREIKFSGVVTFEGLESGQTVIDGGWISTDNLNLTGCITWSDLTDNLQTQLQNMAPELPEYIQDTYIDSTEVRSPTIIGGDFYAVDRSARAHMDGTSFELYNEGNRNPSAIISSEPNLVQLILGAGNGTSLTDSRLYIQKSYSRSTGNIAGIVYVSADYGEIGITFEDDGTMGFLARRISGINALELTPVMPVPSTQGDPGAEGPTIEGETEKEEKPGVQLSDDGGRLKVELPSGKVWYLDDDGLHE